MKTQELLQLLEANKDKALLFEYAPNQFVGANYHITEVKHISIDSVDCGAGVDAWKETIIQLWESPSEINNTEYMGTYKAIGILKKVGTMKAYDLTSEVKFEYGNAIFHTAQLFVNDFEIQESRLVIKLAVEKTDCKAKESCGLPESSELVTEASCCSPESGCC
ncbi:DUF6428 family protein [Ulvibacter antarcticus]|uniref:Uncharacterized protein n=1 Tax=Ulvibacter antarcticus TaxID=442714 RepID=A0A3L9Z039_9FLAO|nr:DUF6428 family protein [Ulvibacter antarcticus]RMA66203.1 hypothetical protein BXY75_0622 [Ulvibacter antarcticus]